MFDTDSDRDRLRQSDPYWPITSSLDQNTLCYLQDPLSTSSASRPGLLNQRPLRATTPCEAFSLTVSCLLTLAFTVTNWLNCHGHLHISFLNALSLPIRSHDTLPFINTGTSLIDGSIKGQYVIVIFNQIIVYIFLILKENIWSHITVSKQRNNF